MVRMACQMEGRASAKALWWGGAWHFQGPGRSLMWLENSGLTHQTSPFNFLACPPQRLFFRNFQVPCQRFPICYALSMIISLHS